jgi:predicted DNA-binding transcriptional regulator YafY
MSRSTDLQKVERLNAAHGLLARGISIAEACALLSRQFAMSRRQAYRYLQEARLLPAPVPIAESTVAVTFKLPPSVVAAVRARAAADGATISETVAQALTAYLARSSGHGPEA